MLLWSLHPKYLDTKGLGGLWFEGIIARNTLLGISEGWKNHPQLTRFKTQPDPIAAIDRYLYDVYLEGHRRGFRYDRAQFGRKIQEDLHIPVSQDQLDQEFQRLLEKLERRDVNRYLALKETKRIEPHSIFTVVPVEIPIIRA